MPPTRTQPAAMTLIEMMLAMAVIAGVLGVLVMVSESLRAENAQSRTRARLTTLRAALVRYHDKHGVWPEGDTSHALGTLLADNDVAQLVIPLGPVCGIDGRWRLRDGYGGEIVYRLNTTHTDDPDHPTRTEADFVSPGADGHFGNSDSSSEPRRQAAVDNLYGSDLEAVAP
ncbi:MAG: hypothetical protein GC164_04280 [Phycisphaera sp.]|nr:hypothetical protein [Phycisphaera sp.]